MAEPARRRQQAPQRSPGRRPAPRPAGARAATRAQPRRGRAAAGRRDRLYLAGITVLVLVLGLMALGPYADLTAAQSRVAALEGQQQELDLAVAELEEEAERLQDPRALEEQARGDLGMVRPGEIPFIVTNPDQADPGRVNAAPVPAEEPADEGPSVVDRVIGWARGWGR